MKSLITDLFLLILIPVLLLSFVGCGDNDNPPPDDDDDPWEQMEDPNKTMQTNRTDMIDNEPLPNNDFS